MNDGEDNEDKIKLADNRVEVMNVLARFRSGALTRKEALEEIHKFQNSAERVIKDPHSLGIADEAINLSREAADKVLTAVGVVERSLMSGR